ncbi:MAG: hypothetical protein LBN10_02235, partial [Propionibacteriaceae bacterium]|nr:hypothetical protein [Propionibacteriaceae bacterium]
MSNTERHATSAKTSKTPAWRRALAGIASGALAIGGLSLSPLFSDIAVPEAEAAVPVSHNFTPGAATWTKVVGFEAVWPADTDGTSGLIEDAIYWAGSQSVSSSTTNGGATSDILGMSYDFSDDLGTYRTRTVLQIHRIPGVSTSDSFDSAVFRTQAMARIGGTNAAPVASSDPAEVRGPAAPLTVYFWNNARTPASSPGPTCGSQANKIVRITSGDTGIYWSCIPTGAGGGWNPGLGGNSTGGEADQATGAIYVVRSVSGEVDNQSSTSTAANTEDAFTFTVWDPLTGKYSLSGSVQPGDWYQGMTTVPRARVNLRANVNGTGNATPASPADFALDADGKIYAYTGGSVSTAYPINNNASIVRVEPARDGNGDIVDGTVSNPWRYYVVTKIQKDPAFPGVSWDSAASIYGNAFLNGQLFNGASTSVGGTYTSPGRVTGGGAGLGVMIKIDPLEALARPSWTIENKNPSNLPTITDNASPQQAAVIRGTLFNDADGDGVITRGESVLIGQKVALYDSEYNLRAVFTTDSVGNYSFIVPWKLGSVYYVRPVQIQAPLAGTSTLANAAQTWGAGSTEYGYASNGAVLTNTATVQCTNGNSSLEAGKACYGAKLPGNPDPALGAIKSTSDPADWLTYAKVEINTSQVVPSADFAFTTVGSYGDAGAGPAATAANIPGHVNQPAATAYLGNTVGSYTGPATDNAAHNGTDNGVYVNSYAGPIELQGTILASTKEYQLAARVSATAPATSTIHGWNTTAGGTAWSAAPTWSPTISGTSAAGPYKFQTGGTITGTPVVQFRADISANASPTLATNANGEYSALASGTPAWTTLGEIEDYTFQVADSVYRPAVKTTSGSGTFTVDGVTFTADNVGFTVGDAKAAPAGTEKKVTAIAPNAQWTATSMIVKDVETGAVLYTPTPFPDGLNSTSITWTPALGDDVIVEVIFSRNPDVTKSTLTLDKESTTVHTNITATATIIDSDNNPLENVIVNWANNSAPVTTITTDPTPPNTCTTGADGKCSIT